MTCAQRGAVQRGLGILTGEGESGEGGELGISRDGEVRKVTECWSVPVALGQLCLLAGSYPS